MTSELDFDAAARLTLKLRKHQRRMEWMSLLFGQMLEQAEIKKVWVAMDYPDDYQGWNQYCTQELGIGGDSEANDLIRIAQLVRRPSVSQDDTNRWEIQDAPAITPRRAEL